MKKVLWLIFVTSCFTACSVIVNPDVNDDLKLECTRPKKDVQNCKCGSTTGTQECLSQGVWGPCSCAAGAGGKGGTGGKGGSGGKAAIGGNSGKAGTTGSGGVGGTKATGGSGGSAEKSTIYGDCTTDTECASPGTCMKVTGTVPSGGSGTAVGYICTESCLRSRDCPTVTSSAQQCSASIFQCALNCSAIQPCPAGATCITIGTGSRMCAWIHK